MNDGLENTSDPTVRPSLPDAPPTPLGSEAGVTSGHSGSHHLIGHDLIGHIEDRLVPAWRRVTNGEARWPVTVAVLAAIVLQAALPQRLALLRSWTLPAIEGAILVVLTVANPHRINRHSKGLRITSLTLIAAMTFSNTFAAARLIRGLVKGTEGTDPTKLLLTGAGIWLTNVVVFSLWYWEFDRGGPAARAHATVRHPDFVFPQMQSPELVDEHWEPMFIDYLYVSFTNATAFSPTDTLPFTRWAKMTMMTQSAVSLITVGLVIARAVNILK